MLKAYLLIYIPASSFASKKTGTVGACLLSSCIFFFSLNLWRSQKISSAYASSYSSWAPIVLSWKSCQTVPYSLFTQLWFCIKVYPKLPHLKPIPVCMKKKWRWLSTSTFLSSLHYTYGFTVQSHLNPYHALNKKIKTKKPFYCLYIFLIADFSIHCTSCIILFHSNIYP